MRLVVQRVLNAKVAVDGKEVGAIQRGYFVLVGIEESDTSETISEMAYKLLHLRVMPDEQGKMNRSITDVAGEILIVSQFTLMADTRQRRPSFIHAAKPEIAKPLFDQFTKILRKSDLKVETGIFGKYMQIDSVADGPVTIILSSSD